MRSVLECLRHAKKCKRMAEQTTDERHRKCLLDAEAHWRTLAAEVAEHQPAHPATDPAPVPREHRPPDVQKAPPSRPQSATGTSILETMARTRELLDSMRGLCPAELGDWAQTEALLGRCLREIKRSRRLREMRRETAAMIRRDL